ncbi:MAG TPA: endonuclease/exonuclease/phosphatase family protein [Thiopseudomonas sp.]|nr:endonuclease/exonuclease/phosphatase family protein [Thiopseudomonas sp.]
MSLLSALNKNARAVLLIVLVFSGTFGGSLYVHASDIIFASWNIQHLGHGHHKKYTGLAAIAGKVDLLAVQEVMTKQGLLRLKKAIEKHTDEQWSYLISRPVGSKDYKEMYAFLWRDSAVELVQGQQTYPDQRKRFIREPFSAHFRSKHDNSELAVGTVHILYGRSIKDRTPEIQALAQYWRWMQTTYPDTALVLAGDFNLPPEHDAWHALKRYAKPLITVGATTLSEKNGRYANLYDNIWVEKDSQLDIAQAGIIAFPKMLKMDHKDSRQYMSDHAPVYMSLGQAELDESVVTIITPDTHFMLPDSPEELITLIVSIIIALLAIFTAKNKTRRQKMLLAWQTIQNALNKQNRSK